MSKTLRRLYAGYPEHKKLVREALRQGFSIEVSGTSHIRFTAPDGRFRLGSASPSDRHAISQLRRDLRKIGLEC